MSPAGAQEAKLCKGDPPEAMLNAGATSFGVEWCQVARTDDCIFEEPTLAGLGWCSYGECQVRSRPGWYS